MSDRYRAALETVAQWDEWAAQRLRELDAQPTAPAEGLDVERLRNATRKAGGWVPEDDEGRATEQEWLDEVAREYSALTPKENRDD